MVYYFTRHDASRALFLLQLSSELKRYYMDTLNVETRLSLCPLLKNIPINVAATAISLPGTVQ